MSPTAQQTPEHSESTCPAGESFIDKADVGRRLRVGLRTVEEWMRLGLLPYYKIGSSVRFKWSEVEAHLAKRCRVISTEARRP